MKRDALPQHEIDRIAARLKAGERTHDIYLSMAATVEEGWFARNAESLYALAEVDPARDADPESLDDVLGAPEPSEAIVSEGDAPEEAPSDDLEPEDEELLEMVEEKPRGKKNRR